MTAKEFLRQYGDCQKRIQSKTRQIQALKDQARDISVTLSERVQSSGNGDSQARIIDTYLDMENELLAETDRLREIQKKVKAAIDTLEDDQQKAVLELRYLEDWPIDEQKKEKRKRGEDRWQWIADEIGYSRRQTIRIHGFALQNIKMSPNVTNQV